jgi:hypothetical protein
MTMRQTLSMILLAAVLYVATLLPVMAEMSDVLAVVDGQEIATADIESRIKGQLLQINNQLYALKKQALDAFIAERLLSQEASRGGFDRS